MKAIDLYNQLEKDFVIPSITENWFEEMSEEEKSVEEYICDNFKQRSLGLFCDFAKEINKVYTAVFPSDEIMRKILKDNITNAMLFLHHPLPWDINKGGFYTINLELLKKLKENRVSLFNFHHPLDNYSEYSTSKTLANAIGIKIEKPFAEYYGAMCGVIGTSECKNIHELNIKYSQAVGHETKLYKYGDDEIINSRIGICAGGGNDVDCVQELIENGINTFISGLSLKNQYSEKVHRLEEEHNINLLGGTHYSSEKFACMAMCKYFNKVGLQSEFITDVPCLEDM